MSLAVRKPSQVTEVLVHMHMKYRNPSSKFDQGISARFA